MNAFHITSFEPRDAEPLRQLLQDADLTVSDLAPEWLGHFLIARQGTDVVGAAGIERYGEAGLLRSVAVRIDRRGSGLGKRLVQAMEMQAGQLGVRHLYLLTTTAPEFFSVLGYRQLGRDAAPSAIRTSTQFSELCPASAVFMVKQLD